MTQPKGAIAIVSLPGMKELINAMMQPKEQLMDDMKEALDSANLNDLKYDEDAYDLYRNEDDWIIATISPTADPVIGYVLANSPSWASSLLTKNDILRELLQQTKKELEFARKAWKYQQERRDIESARLITLHDELEQVKAERDDFAKSEFRLREENTILVSFARYMMNVAFEGGSMDGGDIQDLGVKLGLLVEEQYDPDKHQSVSNGEFDPGDSIYMLSSILQQYRTGEDTDAPK